MTIESVLQEQRDFLVLDTTTWVKRSPKVLNEACMAVRMDSGWERQVIGQDASLFVQTMLLNNIPLTGWNDNLAQSKEQVIEVLEKAIALAGERGI